MKIACVGYIFSDNRITVAYDTVNKNFFVEEEYKDTGFSYSVESKEEVRESLNRFKKSFNK